MKVLRTLALALLVVASVGIAQSQSWQPLHNQPSFSANAALLLTDGRVMVQDVGSACGTSNWWTLTPDNSGSYVKGTWTKVASLPAGYTPLYHSAAVLPDGRLVIVGGEYNGPCTPVWVNKAAIYDPLKNTWKALNPPAGWSQIGDAQSVVLPDGTFMVGNPFDTRIALLNAKKLTFTPLVGKGKADRNDEEGWLLLPNGKVLTTDATNAPNSEVFNSKTQSWSSAGSTIVRLEDPIHQEIGPMVMRPDGTVFATGAADSGPGHTAVYNSKTGKWAKGPDFTGQLDIADGPASLLPNGNVLCMASPGIFKPPSSFFEFDGKKLNSVPAPPDASNDPSFVGDMLLLPTGQVLFTDQTNDVEIYTAKGKPNAAWAPKISSAPSTIARGNSYVIKGTQFNGLSQGSAYGDDTQAATNYPLVRITNNASKHVFYARTHDPSTMAIATGTLPVSTHFQVPASMETGASSLVVVANGIASKAVAVTVQ